MSVRVDISDGIDTAAVENGAVSVSQFPSKTDKSTVIPFVEFFTVNGDGVTSDLKVTGSLAEPVTAFIPSDPDGAIFITEINVLIVGLTGGGKGELRDFAAIDNGLTNGCVLFRTVKDTINEIRRSPLRTNLDWLRIGTLTAPVGAGVDAFQLQDVLPGPQSFAYNPRLDMAAVNPPYGLELKQRSADRVGIIIQDDLNVADVTAFNIIAIGFKKVPAPNT